MSTTIPETQRFARVTQLAPVGRPLPLTGELPGEQAAKGERLGVRVSADDGAKRLQIQLTVKLAEGGEGSVFQTDVAGYVAKIYKRDKLTGDRLEKLRAMIARPIRYKGICFPEAMIYNSENEFVGYLMPEAKGVELSRSVFVPQLLLTKFPSWTREHTIQLCLTILDKIRFLNDRGVILGDINASNILVVSPTEVFFVDCDSYQIEGYPCPVGTAHFTPPEVSGKDFKTFLRTQAMENFAIATLLFMIMLPGKAPYSAVGGSSPAENIKTGAFAYEGGDDALPPGRWGFIWSHTTYKVRRAFYETFKRGEAHFAPAKRFSAAQWSDLFAGYLRSAKIMLRNDPMAMDIFPTRRKMKKCKIDGCDHRFIPTQQNLYIFCDQHVKRPSGPPVVHSAGHTSAVPVGHRTAQQTIRCKNPTCRRSFTLSVGRPGEYCQDCWKKVGCRKCSYVAAKWMHDERNGLCRRCYEEQKRLAPAHQASTRSTVAAPAPNSTSREAVVGFFVAATIATILIFIAIVIGG
ncbi:hypothetical protein [Tessaracoccus lacteus]|uniref:Protein kinase domain-containing protein n=1 Tax=Tessaracoccus lacteus TaxID=3041766 RepID=A0ABY8PW56_9ACTN|nr:hypothetical protein [Tessaracoccus sp. T21]WGT46679.1 hypothetical protein QH948_11100 [Tessaracoccus sp. T21]